MIFVKDRVVRVAVSLFICMHVLWASPLYADIYMYKKDGSYHLTDTYLGSDYIKVFKTKKTKPGVDSPQRNNYNKEKMVHFPDDFSREIQKASIKHGVNPNLIKAVIKAESHFKPDAVSPKGAMGLMQLMPKTAERFNVSDPFDPDQNIDGGTSYLGYLLSLFRGNTRLALAAYNAGENAVKQHGTVPPFKETTSYVRKVLNYFKSSEKKKNLIHKKITPNGVVFFSDNLKAMQTR